MNKKYLILILFIVSALKFFGQDTIYHVNGVYREAVKIVEIEKKRIKYLSNSTDSIYLYVDKDLVGFIKYSSGKIDTIKPERKKIRDRIVGSNRLRNKNSMVDEQIMLLETAAVSFNNSELRSLVKRVKRNQKHYKVLKNVGLYTMICGGVCTIYGTGRLLTDADINSGMGGAIMLSGGGVTVIGGIIVLNSLALNFAKTHKLRKAKRIYNNLVFSRAVR